jgi:hypothetical protein
MNETRPGLLYVLTGKPSPGQILMRFAILVVVLSMSVPALLRCWRALAAVL